MTKYSLMVFLGACSYGVLSTLVKLAYQDGYQTSEITLAQSCIGMAILWTFHLFKKRTAPVRAPFVQLMLAGALIGFTSWLYYRSVQFIPASVAAVLLMQFTWMSLLLDWLLGKRRPVRGQLVCTALILAGTFLATGPTGGGIPDLRGVALALLSAGTYALFIVCNTFFRTEISPLGKSCWMITGSALLMVALVSADGGLKHTSPGLLKWGGMLALFGTVLPPLLFSAAIKQLGAGRSALIMTAELPVAIVSAHLLLAEQLTLVQVTGIVAMLTAIILMHQGDTAA